MSIEEQQFDDLIRSKYLGEEEEPVWDKAKVWESIRPTKHYHFAYFKYAASLAILIGMGILYYVLLGGEKAKNISVQLPAKYKKIIIQPVYEQPISGKQKAIIHPKMSKKFTKRLPFSEKNIENSNKLTKELVVNIISEKNSEVILQKEIPVETANLIAEKIPTNQVIILNIPMEENVRPKQKKRVIGRFFQQIGRYSNGENFDWKEVNSKPNKVWAYLKNSFVADSTIIY